jgi:hypothetical protein
VLSPGRKARILNYLAEREDCRRQAATHNRVCYGGERQISKTRCAFDLQPVMSHGADDEVPAKLQGMLINTAIGLQVAFGAITTGVAAAASSGSRHVSHSSSLLT